MDNQTLPLARQDNLVVQEVNDEVLIYDLKENKAFCLNETSALIWRLCDGNNSVSDISQQLSKKLKSPVTEDFAWLAIDQLKKDNLLDNSQNVEIKFNGLSRREVIRKVGLGTMIALPVVASLVAPTAANAQSPTCVNPGGALVNVEVRAAVNSQGACADALRAQCCSGQIIASTFVFTNNPNPTPDTCVALCAALTVNP